MSMDLSRVLLLVNALLASQALFSQEPSSKKSLAPKEEYILYKHSRLPYSFEYPKEWDIYLWEGGRVEVYKMRTPGIEDPLTAWISITVLGSVERAKHRFDVSHEGKDERYFHWPELKRYCHDFDSWAVELTTVALQGHLIAKETSNCDSIDLDPEPEGEMASEKPPRKPLPIQELERYIEGTPVYIQASLPLFYEINSKRKDIPMKKDTPAIRAQKKKLREQVYRILNSFKWWGPLERSARPLQ